MATVTTAVGAWACPANEVDCLPGGFTYSYDDVEFPGGAPRDDCGDEEPSAQAQAQAQGGDGVQSVQATSVPAPTASNTKAEIIAWLLDNGVTLSEPALSNLTKAELLDLVADVQDG